MEERKIICNMCGMEYETENEIARKDFLCIEKDWGYFSEKDGQRHEIIICENCYDKWVKQLRVKPLITQTKELL